MEKKILPYIIVFSAISVSISAIFYSVTGLGKMFAGADTEVMIMATALEIAKLVALSVLYNYWKELGFLVRSYLITAVLLLMMITSGGIYGYLSAAYAETKSKTEMMDKQFVVMDSKREQFSDKLASYQSEKERINDNISELTGALSNNVIQYKDRETGKLITTTSSSNRKVYVDQLEKSENRRDLLSNNITAMSDSISSIDMNKIEIEQSSDIADELGSLSYISELTGKTRDQVVNWFIIALMSVFDPLAVALVIAANIAFGVRRKEKSKEDLVNSIDDRVKEFEDKETEFKKSETEFNNRLKVIEDKETEFNSREKEFQIKLDEKERESEVLLSKKIKNLDSEIEYAKSEVNKLDIEMKNSNDDLTRTLKEEKKRVQNMEYELTEDRAKVKESQDKYKEILISLDKEREEIKIERSKVESDREEFKSIKIKLDSKVKEFDEFKKTHSDNNRKEIITRLGRR